MAGDLVGKTLFSGVYKSSSSLGLTGTLTLDAQGDPDAVFIFQVGSALTTGSASQVKMINGAQACHVFWQVGSSATLGTHSTFVGTIMASESITVTTGTTVAGRALARNGAVTLDSNTFTPATCATTPSPIPTSTTLSAVPNPATVGDTVTLTATVTAQGASPVTTGTVSFPVRGGTVLGTATLDQSGHATLTVPAGSAGSRTITAHYKGHLTLASSTSPPITLVTRSAGTSSSTAPTSTAPTSTAPSGTTTSGTTTSGTTTSGTTTSGTTLAATGTQHITGLTTGAAVLLLAGFACLWTARPRYRPRHRR